MKHAEGVTAAARECQFTEEARQDKELNSVYGLLLEKLDGYYQPDLQKSQRAWLVYRDAECKLEADPESGGTLALLDAGDCWIALTEDRIKRLRGVLKEELQP